MKPHLFSPVFAVISHAHPCRIWSSCCQSYLFIVTLLSLIQLSVIFYVSWNDMRAGLLSGSLRFSKSFAGWDAVSNTVWLSSVAATRLGKLAWNHISFFPFQLSSVPPRRNAQNSISFPAFPSPRFTLSCSFSPLVLPFSRLQCEAHLTRLSPRLTSPPATIRSSHLPPPCLPSFLSALPSSSHL